MKLSQLKKILKESAKEAVVEVLNELLTQQPNQPIQENFKSFHVTTPNSNVDLGAIRAKMNQMFQQEYAPQQVHSITKPLTSNGKVPDVIPQNYLNSLMKTVASRTSSSELKDFG